MGTFSASHDIGRRIGKDSVQSQDQQLGVLSSCDYEQQSEKPVDVLEYQLGYTQKEEIDYMKIHSPVVRDTSRPQACTRGQLGRPQA